MTLASRGTPGNAMMTARPLRTKKPGAVPTVFANIVAREGRNACLANSGVTGLSKRR